MFVVKREIVWSTPHPPPHYEMYLCNITREREGESTAILRIMTKHEDADGARPSHTVIIVSVKLWLYKKVDGASGSKEGAEA